MKLHETKCVPANGAGGGAVRICTHVQIGSSVAAEFGSDHHRIHRSESAKTACFRADGETEEKNKLRFEIPTPSFPARNVAFGSQRAPKSGGP